MCVVSSIIFLILSKRIITSSRDNQLFQDAFHLSLMFILRSILMQFKTEDESDPLNDTLTDEFGTSLSKITMCSDARKVSCVIQNQTTHYQLNKGMTIDGDLSQMNSIPRFWPYFF
jgi:hypothetical protein